MATSRSGKATDNKATPEVAGTGEVQAKMDEINAQGYHGERADSTPLENYTLPGVTANKPTPETQKES